MHSLVVRFVCLILALQSPHLFAQKAQSLDAKSQQAEQKETIASSDIERFATVMAQVQHYYINPIGYKKLLNLAMQGILHGLDPHSSYLDEENFEAISNQTKGSYAGIGIHIIPENSILKVIAPVDGSPAARAGILPGDYIVRIDQYFVQDMGPMEATQKLKGKVGSTVKLTLYRPETKQPVELKVKRAEIQLKTVNHELLSPEIGYIRIGLFNVETAKETKTAIEALKKQSPKLQGLILDLRNNPGGTLGGASDTTNLFLDKQKLKYEGRIVSIEGRAEGLNHVIYADDHDIWEGKPIIVLINKGSASGSEILAAALQEHNRAITMGTKSFGKGSVQTVIPVSEKTAIKLTTALYYTPKHVAIQAVGVEPEVVIPAMTIPKEEKETTIMDVLDEANLYGHLKAAPKALGKNEKSLDNHALAQKDFQLFQAVKLIQGLLASTR